MTGRENRTRETRDREIPAETSVTAPLGRRPASGHRFPIASGLAVALALGLAAAPSNGAKAQSRDGQLRFPGADSHPATPGFPSEPAHAAPVVVGGAGSGVSVDFSVLDALEQTRGRRLLFPDPNFRGNRERVELTPPGTKGVTLTPPGDAKPASKSTAKAAPKPQPPSPDIRAARPAPKPAAPEGMKTDVPPGTASAPPPPNAESKAKPKAEPKPEPKAAPRTQVAKRPDSAPAPERAPEPAPETASVAPSEPATPPSPAFDRSSVPPPPMASVPANPANAGTAANVPAGAGTAANVPPVDPAPRTGVARQKMQPPEPPPASAPAAAEKQAAAAPKDTQTAALPPADADWTPGQTRVVDFPAGGAKLPDDGAETLKAAARAVAADNQLRVELKAYAAGDANSESQARRLSLSRALSVRSFLIREGVQSTRIDVRALGNRVPDGKPDRVDVTVVSR